MSDRPHDEIARYAFALFEARGREHGSDWQDWFQAERAVKPGAGDWHVEAPSASLSADVDSATLALRLGIAVNAIRATQRFFYFTKDTPGSGGERDRLWAFLLALGFLHEAVQQLLRPNFPKVKTLAQAGGADENLIQAAAALLSGKVPMTRVLDRMRNKLIFHWDDEPIREFVTKYAKATVTWADGTGDTQGESFYRAAADSLTNSVLPDDPAASAPETPERSMERLGELMREVLPATDRVLKLFDFAIIGHVNSHGAKLRSGSAS